MGLHQKKKGCSGRTASRAIIAGVLCVFLTGCGIQTERWAYIHDPGTEILRLDSNGRARFHDAEYTWSKDDKEITLTDVSGTPEIHRYRMDGDKMVFYERSVYTRDESEVQGDGLIGVWKQDNGWLFQFTEAGKFSEENIFFGSYSVDEEAGSIHLMYDDPIEDATLYYELGEDGEHLTIDYPWPMVHYSKNGTAEKESGTVGP